MPKNYVVGLAFMTVGALVTIGGVTGRLAVMIGALFAPSYLVSQTGTGDNPLQSIATSETQNILKFF